MNILENAVECIKTQGKNYKKYSNEWNVMQQLIDIITAQPESAEIVLQNLKIKEMQLTALVQKITGKRLADPMKVMEEICDFYKIEVPDVLPPEYWRGPAAEAAKKAAAKPDQSESKSKYINLMELL